MKSFAVHYKNKYVDGHVSHDENSLDVYDDAGALCVCLRRDGHGKIVDRSAEYGAIDYHNLDPIPKNARVHKICALTGVMKFDEKAKERVAIARKLAVDGKILSIQEYKQKGFIVDADGNVSVPQAPAVPEPPKAEKSDTEL